MVASTPVKTHGGKAYLANRIRELFPPHLHYVEPFAGGLSVLLAGDGEGVSEVVNDLNGELVNFWRVLRSDVNFPKFQRSAGSMPFAEAEWGDAGKPRLRLVNPDDPEGDWRAALRFFVRCRQSLAGRMNSFTGVTKTRTRRGMNNEVSAWLSAVEGLPAVHARLKRVLILGPRPALEVIRSQDGPQTLFYLDPPYLTETRTAPDVYAHEMSRDDHFELLLGLGSLAGKFVLSGYPSELYDSFAARSGWRRVDFDIANHASGGAEKRRMVECCWLNY